jgi:SAM-dependent methyltransferase
MVFAQFFHVVEGIFCLRELHLDGNYRTRLFADYSATHVAHLHEDDVSKLKWFRRYFIQNYLRHIEGFDRQTARVLEIGCNRGYLLSALKNCGFQNLNGIDLSQDCLERAKSLIPDSQLDCVDALVYLKNRPGNFDIIILKAVLEHTPKVEVFPFLEGIRRALNERGVVIVDVPNMDWLFATHERYMDFTHEVGFTKESLRQVLSSVFPTVEVVPADRASMLSGLDTVKLKLGQAILTMLFSWADPEGAHNPIWSRSLIGVARNLRPTSASNALSHFDQE